MAASSTTITSAGPARPARSFVQRLRAGDEVAYLITFAAAASILLVTGLLVFELYVNSSASRAKFGLSFLVTKTWDPVAGQFGAWPFIYGTVVTSALALLIGIPLGVGAAIFLAELAPPAISDALTF
jgi:phosphate transport system permease protein